MGNRSEEISKMVAVFTVFLVIVCSIVFLVLREIEYDNRMHLVRVYSEGEIIFEGKANNIKGREIVRFKDAHGIKHEYIGKKTVQIIAIKETTDEE